MNENYGMQQNVGQVGISLRDIENARTSQLNTGLGSMPQGGYGPGYAATPTQGEIESQLDILDNQLKSLLAISNMVTERFVPVLSTGLGKGSVGPEKQAPMQTQIGNRLYTMNMQATQLRESLQDIIDRCKL